LTDFGEIITADLGRLYAEFTTGKINETRFWRQLDIANYRRIKDFIIREMDERLDDRYNTLVRLTDDFNVKIINEFPKEWFNEIASKHNIVGISLDEIREEPYSKEFYDKLVSHLRNLDNIKGNILLADNDPDRIRNASNLGVKTCLILDEPLLNPKWYPNFLIPDFDSLTELKSTLSSRSGV